MGSLYAKPVVDTALNEIGYQADGKYNKYAEELDKVNFFNGKKNGIADWCAIFVCWCAYVNTLNADGEVDPDKWDAHYFLFQPDKDNCAAGCGYAADYYMQNDAWTDNPERGDQVFFKKTNDVYYHTGLVVDWDDEGIYTVEGNVNGGKVEKRFYRYDDSRIAGYGRPRYDGWELESDPDPIPEPDPEPTTEEYRVYTNGSFLRLRSEPNTDSDIVACIPNGTIIDVSEIVEGEMIDWETDWAKTTYKGETGYCSCRWLDKV